MYTNLQPIILASGSPRRQEFLREMGLDFTVRLGTVAEEPNEAEKPEDFVRRMAAEKAAVVSAAHPEAWVIAGDTVVCFGRKILGKPVDEEDAVAMLMALSGREHRVLTGFCVAHGGRGEEVVDVATTYVRFVHYSEKVARAYVATGESLDKAGAYGIQGKGGCLVESIDGSYTNVVGLPLCQLMQLLEARGVIASARPAGG